MSDVLLSLGSNIGDRAANLAEAIRRLGAEPGVVIRAISPVYRTVPVGPVTQDDFVNGAVRIETDLAPEALMRRCLAIEAAMGRDREKAVRWGPRLIDIDIILFDDMAMDTQPLQLPHPRFHERAFVLVPIADIAPEWIFRGQSLAHLAELIDRAGVERV